jgi:hypothetical protein
VSGDRALARARSYLERRADRNRRPLECGSLDGVSQVVVIPVLAEGAWLFRTLTSLAANDRSELRRTLVICVVNNRPTPAAAGEEVADNRETLHRLRRLLRARAPGVEPAPEPGLLRLGVVDASSPECEIGPRMGVGEARRIGLDHGLRVLCEAGAPRGPLLSLDADTLVAPDYLGRVCEHFAGDHTWAAVVAYEHTLPRDPDHRRAILLYELFLRYHELGLRLAGSPYAFPTLGSAMVARADAYVAVGGMNRRQAGEDFYFLQQLAKTGTIARIESTTVHPAPRPSARVPFGTGASVRREVRAPGALMTVYDPEAYAVIGRWLRFARGRLDATAEELMDGARKANPVVGDFLAGQRFAIVWPRLRKHASDRAGLEAQLHRWFDAFKTLKLIHLLRDTVMPVVPLFPACCTILERSGVGSGAVDWRRVGNDEDARIELLRVMRLACRRTAWHHAIGAAAPGRPE